MRKLTLLAALFAPLAYANPLLLGPIDCEKISEHAVTIMEDRQAEERMETMLISAQRLGRGDPKLTGLHENIVIDAFKQPLISSSRIKQITYSAFQAKWYQECITQFPPRDISKPPTQ